jgi:hypothetical protein
LTLPSNDHAAARRVNNRTRDDNYNARAQRNYLYVACTEHSIAYGRDVFMYMYMLYRNNTHDVSSVMF